MPDKINKATEEIGLFQVVVHGNAFHTYIENTKQQ